ncbi:MAG: carboxylesterase family protein, partial [Anaerolineae bacterium]|nr:carboxylesterase family protein [Anaerolineae bacterium]
MEQVGHDFATHLLGNENNPLTQLRQMPAAELYKRWRTAEEFHRFHPVIDGYVLPEAPTAVFAHGKQAPVPLMVGSNA